MYMYYLVYVHFIFVIIMLGYFAVLGSGPT